MFKKRQNSSANFRRGSGAIVESEMSDLEDEVRAVDELKSQQAMRKKPRGVLIDGWDNDTRISAKESKVQSSDSSIGSQFTVQAADGLSGEIKHERLMEAYVEQKLGTSKPQSVPKILTPEDALYIVPDKYKVIKNTSVVDENDITMLSMGGIAEVALPMEFKIRNIEATEEAAKKLSEQRKMKGGPVSNPRFQVGIVNSSRGTQHSKAGGGGAEPSGDPSVSLPPSTSTAPDKPSAHPHRNHRTDDIVLAKYRQQNLRKF